MTPEAAPKSITTTFFIFRNPGNSLIGCRPFVKHRFSNAEAKSYVVNPKPPPMLVCQCLTMRVGVDSTVWRVH